MLMTPQGETERRAETAGGRRVILGVVGPTGSGKSELSIELARRFDGEVVSCDALQVYQGLDIGTGKLTFRDRSGVPHHLIDLLEPDRSFSAADYVRTAAPIIEDIDRRGRLPLVVGGTGLYLRSLRRGLFDGPGRSAGLRERLRVLASRRGTSFLHRLLRRLDPVSAERVHPNDLVRLVRALEVRLVSSRTMSDMMKERRSSLEAFRFTLLGLDPPRQDLVRRIANRVSHMLERGFVDEVRSLLERYGPRAPGFKAIGYRQVARHLEGHISLSEARELTIRATVQYAKRQMTWFRHEDGIHWFLGFGDRAETVEAAREYVSSVLQDGCPLGKGTLYAEAAS